MSKSTEWKLVPVEPTRQMREAFHEANERYEEGFGGSPDIQWGAMLRVAPSASEPRDDYKAWYDEAMEAGNEAGYAGMCAADVIRHLDQECSSLKDDIAKQRELLRELSNWLVCEGIATPEDMSQSFTSFREAIDALLDQKC